MKIKLTIIGALAFGLFAVSAQAQSTSVPTLIPPLTNTTIVINGQTYLLTETNGVYTAITSGPGGNVSVTTPTSFQDALSKIQLIVSENNPTNADFYSTNEIELRLGGIYQQDSGQAAAVVSITKWGLIPNQPIGFEAGLLQGNQSGTSGTAGGYGAADYRWIIGDVAAIVGVGGGYDNYNAKPFGLVKAGVEYRLSKNVGSWVDLNYAGESSGNATRGFGFAAGVSYAFSSFSTLK